MKTSAVIGSAGFRRSVIAVVIGLGLTSLFSEARPAEQHSSKTSSKSFIIAGYVPDYRVESLDPAVGALLTDLIFFSIQPRAEGSLDGRRLSAVGLRKLHAIRKAHKTRLLVAVGGWERSAAFAGVAGDSAKRSRFVDELLRFCLSNKFDGVDFDWEHPANKAENDSYSALLTDVKRAFAPRGLLVSVTLAGWQDPGPAAYRAVDRLQIMAYDQDGARHSTFANAKADVERFLARGVAKERICLGLPFYGRGMKDRNLVLTYAEIVRHFRPAPGADEAGGVYFNGIRTIEAKTRYARDAELGGVMIWELGQDTGTRTLLRAVRKSAE